mmetsp:Transcript_30125/g.46025  ORF Transcript_30125/g.46025 Transcript_30125/m.46025 type:complete len:149 (+) Transcript_30125:738-1184(+)
MAGFAPKKEEQKEEKGEKEEKEVEEVLPLFRPPKSSMQVMVALEFRGVMRRMRINKNKNEYKQVIFSFPFKEEQPESKDKKTTTLVKEDPLLAKFKAISAHQFARHLPPKFLVTDKKIKELQDVVVRFSPTGGWKESWPLAKVVAIEK